MINGLAVLGWGVGGIEAEAAMLGQPVSMLIPEVVGFRLTGRLREGVTATDLVLTVTQMLRKFGVVDKFVEFFGPGLNDLPLADRATIANMAPEYGATCGFFPIDRITLDYLTPDRARRATPSPWSRAYAKAQGLWRECRHSRSRVHRGAGTRSRHGQAEPGRAEAAAGPGRSDGPEGGDRTGDPGWRRLENTACRWPAPIMPLQTGGRGDRRHHLLHQHLQPGGDDGRRPGGQKGAWRRGCSSKPWVKTSLAPGSKVVTDYLEKAGLQAYLDTLGFNLVGYGCTTCIGNSGPLAGPIAAAIEQGDLTVGSVLSGNRNFEGRIHAQTRVNWLASPPLVVAFALAGTTRINLDTRTARHRQRRPTGVPQGPLAEQRRDCRGGQDRLRRDVP